jgi:hypothetical protein
MKAAYTVRRIRLPKWPNAVALTLMLGSIGLVFWLDSAWPAYLLCFVPVFLLWHFFRLNRCRCPQCGGRLEMRAEETDGMFENRLVYLDCASCRITWDPNLVVPDSN